MLRKASWFVCFLVLAMSCLDEPDCFRLNNNIIGIAFKKMIGGAPDTVALIGVQASGTDVIFNEFVLTNGIYLPLNFFTTQTSFLIQGLNGQHTLDLGYDVRTQFVSDECGARYVLSNLSLLGYDNFDSIRVVNASPFSSEAGANIEIYRCPITNLVEVSFRQLQMENSVVLARKIVNVVDYSGIPAYVDTTLQAIYLPLNPEAESSTFTLTMADQELPSDISMAYKRLPRTFFDICGEQQTFGRLDITSAAGIDSIHVVNDSIHDPPVTNITIYKCPQTNMMRLYFRQPGAPVRADTIYIKKITDDYSANVYYDNPDPALGYTFVTIPLNPAASGTGTTEFTFELHDGTIKTLGVAYNAVQTELFNACGTQAIFSGLSAPTSNFTAPPIVRVTTVQYPIATNIEIIQ
jgi:hypothetical protein